MENRVSPVTAERVYVHLYEQADSRGRVVTTSRSIARDMDGVSPTTVQRSVVHLAANAGLKVLRHGGRHPSVYQLLREPDYELAELFTTRSPSAA